MPETEPVVLVAPDYDEHVAVVTINRAKKKGALSEEVVLLLTAAFLELGDDKRISAVVLRSEGTGFSAGDDLMGVPPSAQQAQTCIRAMELCQVCFCRLLAPPVRTLVLYDVLLDVAHAVAFRL
jgi:enoyl-CoA hydratase/carnithine racemase